MYKERRCKPSTRIEVFLGSTVADRCWEKKRWRSEQIWSASSYLITRKLCLMCHLHNTYSMPH